MATTVFVVGVLHFLRIGYDYGISDQDEFLPSLIHRLHPLLLQSDWFVQIQSAQINVRTGILVLLEPIARVFSLPGAVLVVYILAFVFVVTALFRLARHFGGSASAAALSCLLIIVVTPHWNLGGNEFVGRMLVPGMIAWAAALWGLVFFFEQRFVTAGGILGIAALMQPVVGLQIMGVAVLVSGFEMGGWSSTGKHVNVRRRLFRTLVPAVFSFTVVAAPLLVPLVLAQVTGNEAHEAFLILTQIRAPHHFLPDAFSTGSSIRFFGLIFLAGGAFLAWRRRARGEIDRSLHVLIVVVLSILAFAWIATDVFHSETVTRVQPFKISVLAKGLLLVYISLAVTRHLPTTWHRRIDQWTCSRVTLLVIVGLTVLIALLTPRIPWIVQRAMPFVERSSSTETLMLRWIRTNTPIDAVFAIPPSMTGFQVRAERPAFVNFKAVPYHPQDMLTWYGRLSAIAPLTEPGAGGIALLKMLDASYHQRSIAEMNTTARRWDIQYFLRSTPVATDPASDHTALVHQIGNWWLYDMDFPNRNSN